MRVFVAINFSADVKDEIYAVLKRLREQCVKGRFTSYDNLHLTLAFIGEADGNEIQDIIAGLNMIRARPFTFTISGSGKFHRASGDIYWLGINSAELIALRRQVYALLKDYNIDSKFTAHITLGRDVRVTDDITVYYDDITVEVTSVELMKSERISDKLVYTTLYTKTLQ
ncbi:MAG: RNA 2',3'-cyclic phosphodiesterase [Christensenellales bacterium]|jgi:2'-5' RNA ligase